jgi:hypothetical protein
VLGDQFGREGKVEVVDGQRHGWNPLWLNKNGFPAGKPICRYLVPRARLELAHLSAADFESAASTDSATGATEAGLSTNHFFGSS